MAPITILLVFIHLIGELAKPVTLTLRLFGNITGEDVVIAALVILGVGVFFPLQTLFFPLGLLFSFIQALVFTILSSVYILLFMHHGEIEESH
jgi:F-type H+-transporting ATPase subunit a